MAKRAENADKAITCTAMLPSLGRAPKQNKLGRATEKLEQAKAGVCPEENETVK